MMSCPDNRLARVSRDMFNITIMLTKLLCDGGLSCGRCSSKTNHWISHWRRFLANKVLKIRVEIGLGCIGISQLCEQMWIHTCAQLLPVSAWRWLTVSAHMQTNRVSHFKVLSLCHVLQESIVVCGNDNR